MSRYFKRKKNEEPEVIKIVVDGSPYSGKSTLINTYLKKNVDYYYAPGDYAIRKKNIIHKGKNYNLEIWDISHRQLKTCFLKRYYSSASGFILTCDTSNETLTQLDKKYNDMRQGCIGNVPIILVFTKSDMEKEFDYNKFNKYAANKKMKTLSSGMKITEAEQVFNTLVSEIVSKDLFWKVEEEKKTIIKLKSVLASPKISYCF